MHREGANFLYGESEENMNKNLIFTNWRHRREHHINP
jgi:hypothetical protein